MSLKNNIFLLLIILLNVSCVQNNEIKLIPDFDYKIEELIPDMDWTAWYKKETGLYPDTVHFGAYVTKSIGDDLYIGFASARPAEKIGALLAHFDGYELTAVESLGEQGIHCMEAFEDTLYIAGTDPAILDNWNYGNFYVYNQEDGVIKYRRESGLENVLHMWGLYVNNAGDLYAAVSSATINYLDKCLFGETCYGEIYKSTNGGRSWVKKSMLGGFRAYDILEFNGKLYAVCTDSYYSRMRLAVSDDDGETWISVPGLDNIKYTLFRVYKNELLMLSRDQKSIYALDEDSEIKVYGIIEGIRIAPYRDDRPYYAYYNQSAVDSMDNLYVLTDTGDVLRTDDLVNWDVIAVTDMTLISISYWENENKLIIGSSGFRGKLWQIEL